MSTAKPTSPSPVPVGGIKLATTSPAASGAATLTGEATSSASLSPSKNAKACEVHGGIRTWRTDLLSQTHIGCWRCHMEQAWDAPPEKRHSTQSALAGALSLVKGKAPREEAINEVLGAVFKEGEKEKKERERLGKKVEALGVENREVGKQWVVAQARVKELEGDEKKLTGQLDKMMACVEGLEAEKEQLLETALLLDGQLKHGDKEREALRNDVKEYEGRIKELESQLAALQEQTRVSTARLRDELAAALLKSSSSSKSFKQQTQQSAPSPPPTPIPAPQAPSPPPIAPPAPVVQQQQQQQQQVVAPLPPTSTHQQQQPQQQTAPAWPVPMPTPTTTTAAATAAAAAAAAAAEVTSALSSSTTTTSSSSSPNQQQQAPSAVLPTPLMTTMSAADEATAAAFAAATAGVSSSSLASTPGGGEGVEKKKRNSIGAFFKGLTGKKNGGETTTVAATTPSSSSNIEADSSNSSRSSSSSNGAVATTTAAAPAEASPGKQEKHLSSSSSSFPSSSSASSPPRPKISVIAHMNGQERVAFTMYKSDRFQKVMERYLTVKNIDAPVDEVRFVVDTHHHTLAPELTPDDFGLEEGATINVCVPAEYLLEPVIGKEGEKEAVGAVPVVAPVREEGGKEGGEKEAGKEGGDMDAYM